MASFMSLAEILAEESGPDDYLSEAYAGCGDEDMSVCPVCGYHDCKCENPDSYDLGCAGCLSTNCDECSEYNQYVDDAGYDSEAELQAEFERITNMGEIPF